MASDNTYWQDVEKKKLDPEELKSEFKEGELSFDIGDNSKSRRDFLKIMGFSFAATSLTSCLKIPVKKALPYLNKHEDTIPGVANWYATSMDPLEGESLLVKTREGRPIKIEGNPLSSYEGATTAYTQGSLLSLYDSARYKNPEVNGVASDWENIDKELRNKILENQSAGKKMILVTSSISSPSLLKLISTLKSKYNNFEHVVYETGVLGSILDANEETFGSRNYPDYRFDQADYVLSFSADFLGTWISPASFTRAYTKS